MCAKMFGAYVGEVVVRSLGGRWVAEMTEDGGTRWAVDVDRLKGYPLEKIWKRLTESEFDGVAAYCSSMRAILARRS